MLVKDFPVVRGPYNGPYPVRYAFVTLTPKLAVLATQCTCACASCAACEESPSLWKIGEAYDPRRGAPDLRQARWGDFVSVIFSLTDEQEQEALNLIQALEAKDAP